MSSGSNPLPFRPFGVDLSMNRDDGIGLSGVIMAINIQFKKEMRTEALCYSFHFTLNYGHLAWRCTASQWHPWVKNSTLARNARTKP